MKLLSLFLLITLISPSAFSKPTYSKDLVLGNILKGTLEGMHLSNKKIDDNLSSDAFNLYIERIDYGKQFYLQSDVDKLSAHKKDLDNQLSSGNLKIVEESNNIFKNRLIEVEGFTKELLSKKFEFDSKEVLESDPKKRKFLKTSEELKDLWRRMLKYETLSRYTELKEEQDTEPKDAKEKKKKAKTKKKSDDELQAEAREKVGKSYERIFARLKKENQVDLNEKFYNSLTRVFDPHTQYLPPEDKEDFDIDMSGKLEGIGALLREEGAYIKVERVIPGSASWKQKELQAGDTILKVGQADADPIDIVDMPLRDAVKLIRGKKGSTVSLTVKTSSGAIKVIPIQRDVVQLEESYVKGVLLEDKKSATKYGYIKVPKFYRDFNDSQGRNCTEDVKKELEHFKKENVEAVILDLRNNGGGALDDARMMAGLFIGKGPVVQVKASSGAVEILKNNSNDIVFEKPVVVLINKLSASASEIVAGALQDYGRAIVVGGMYSHGKGTVQAVIDLDAYLSPLAKSYSPLGALKITIQKFYRVNGSSTQYKGIIPDIILPEPFDYLESGEKYLDFSLPWAKVNEVPYQKWNKYTYNLKELKGLSDKRVKENMKFQKIDQSNKLYNERKEKTEKVLTQSDYLKEREIIKAEIEKNKIEQESDKFEVTSLEKIQTKEQKESFGEYQKELKKDPFIEESIEILHDAIAKVKTASK
ncbi:MAG: carboxy terminal-processing peptidase [Bacteriovoracaceae bacterium]|nr:carboxy terminal-processing peptidase [Bacteriovoracaceae bacterium]